MAKFHTASITVWGQEYKVLIQSTGMGVVTVTSDVYDDIPTTRIENGKVCPVEIETLETHYHFDKNGIIVGYNTVTGDGYMVDCTSIYCHEDASVTLTTTYNDGRKATEKQITARELGYDTGISCAEAALGTAKNQNSFKLWQRDCTPLSR